MLRLAALAFLACTFVPAPTQAETYLLMAEEDGCYWCARWNEEIGHIYPKTAEGKTAPLQRYDVHGEAPQVTFERRVHFTPTFILVKDNTEVGRLEGYPGEDFFWGLLSQMFTKAKIQLEPAG